MCKHWAMSLPGEKGREGRERMNKTEDTHGSPAVPALKGLHSLLRSQAWSHMRWGGEEGIADWSTVMSNTSPGCSHASFSRSRPGNKHPAHPCATTSKLVQFPLFHSGLWNCFPDTQHHNLIFVLEDNGCYETWLLCHSKASGEFPLEEGMAPHSSILAWKSHGQRSLADFMGSQKSQTWLSNYTTATKVSESYFPFM